MESSVYQPLSHALNPPLPAHHQHRQPSYQDKLLHPHPAYSNDDRADRDAHARSAAVAQHPVHEEEEEEDEVEGAVVPSHMQTNQQASSSRDAPPRRKPGRPKGSKNKKPRFDVSSGVAKQAFATSADLMQMADKSRSQTQQQKAKPAQQPPPSETASPVPPQQPQQPSPAQVQQTPTPGPSAASSHPPTATSSNQVQTPASSSTAAPKVSPINENQNSNQAFYDFQWRILNLCSEFYSAANELIVNTPQHIVHQCYALPGNQLDPISLLAEARKACDQLMANPTAIILKKRPPTPYLPKPPAPQISASPPIPVPVITAPASFAMPLGSAPPSASPPVVYPPPAMGPPVQYPPAYYTYTVQSQSSAAAPYAAQQQVMKPVQLTTPSSGGNQGTWTDEETEKLKKLAEDSKTAGLANGEIDWEWVVNQYGTSRSRHQILIKATNLGLKSSTSRSGKRRRDTDTGRESVDLTVSANRSGGSNGGGSSSGNPGGANRTPSATHSPQISGNGNPPTSANGTPTIKHASAPERPLSSTSSASPVTLPPQGSISTPVQPPAGGTILHWPMPTIAANTPSPVMTGSRSVYYDQTQRRGK